MKGIMRLPASDLLPPTCVAAALAVAAAVFVSETDSFRRAVAGWAARDLEARTELAAQTLSEPLRTGDFRRLHEFGADCSSRGVRLTVFSGPGGIVFDSVGRPEDQAESMYALRQSGEFRVRLGIPVERVMAPYRRARLGFILAAIVGGAGVMLVLLFTVRQRMRLRELARERDAQRRLVDEMKKVEAFRRDFIADVSHEIKTPLTGIIGVADLLASGGAGGEGGGRLLGMLKAECERLNELAQGILSLSSLERDGAAADMADEDLAAIVGEVVERFRPMAAEHGMEIGCSGPGECLVRCDGRLVSGAVSNLVANAIRHSGSADVLVSLSERGGAAEVAVEDHGVGIPPEERERVFERFHRVDRARSADTGGAGLGLAIVRGVARLHGGDVRLEPATPSGCRFVLSIPVGKEAAPCGIMDARQSIKERKKPS